MIPIKDTLVNVDSLPGEEIEFGIGDPRWVMRTQAALYSDITTAIIREYSTNAYDAHTMAGHSDPIEVTLPSALDPFFTVTDHGVGMSVEDFRKIYTQFGTSPKRAIKNTNGLMGYGSKSGVAYTTSFSVTSIKDGIKAEGVILRKEDWQIVLKVVRTSKTDEPNGTKIVIPVHNIEEFNAKANKFYSFWLPGRVLVNGKAPKHNVGKKIIDGLYYPMDYGSSYVVMGNVPYRINNPARLFDDKKMNYVNFVAYVDDAEVEFTPSREDLSYTDATKRVLSDIVGKFEDNIIKAAAKDIKKAVDHPQAYERYTEWRNSLGRQMFDTLTYKGDKFTPQFKVKGWRYVPNKARYSTQHINEWNVESSPTTMYVTDFTPNDLTASHKAKARHYIEEQNWTVRYVVFTAASGSEIVSPWISRDKFVDFETLKKAMPKKQPVANPGYAWNAGRVKGSWDYYENGNITVEQPIPSNVPVYWISTAEHKRYRMREIMNSLNEKGAVVLIVPGNREGKLLRENPKIKHYIQHARTKVISDGESLLDDDAKRVVTMDTWALSQLRRMDKNRIDDPELRKILEIADVTSPALNKYNHHKSLANALWANFTPYRGESYSISKKYPLVNFNNREHSYLYINAVYQAREKDSSI